MTEELNENSLLGTITVCVTVQAVDEEILSVYVPPGKLGIVNELPVWSKVLLKGPLMLTR